MQVILSLIPDPSETVIQGLVIGDTPMGASSVPVIPSLLDPVLQGCVIGDKKLGDPVPRAMIGQSDLYGVPKQIGPKVFSGGEVFMLDIGKGVEKVLVDSTQSWLLSQVPLNSTGAFLGMDSCLFNVSDILQAKVVQGDSLFKAIVNLSNPRREVVDSGLAKRMTAALTPLSFGAKLQKTFIEGTTRWFVTGITKDSTGATLGGCRVVLMQTDKILVNPDILANPIITETVSDGGGNYSIQVPKYIPYQVISYKSGSPDVAGITRNDVMPVAV